MGNKNSTPQRRNTDNTEQQLQYHTPQGPIPANNVPQQLENVPDPGTRTRSRYPHAFRGREGPAGNETRTFDDYVTGPGRAHGPTGPMHEYPIATAGEPFHFRYEDRTINARQARRQIHPNERANVMGTSQDKPPNDPKQTRAAVRVAHVNGKAETVVVGVVAHPEGHVQRFERAPLEPLSREGRQAAQRQTDERLRGRTPTYPPRGLDAGFVQTVETRHQRLRAPAHPEIRAR